MKKRFLWIGLVFILAVFTFIYFHWFAYLFHHAKSHIHNLKNQYEISEILNSDKIVPKEPALAKKLKLTARDIQKLKLIESVKIHGKKIYHLKEIDTYEKFVALDRSVLGKNLIVAEPLELKLKTFYFPFIGDFGYLGFFDFDLLKQFEKDYRDQGLDTYTSTIAAFTYLNYFKDPIFSTYLNFSDYQIISLVMHEMAHVRLYFKDDTDFSESIASFIETPAAENYIEKILNKKLNPLNINRLKKEYKEFNLLIEQTKKKLKLIFQSNLSPQEKRKQKKNIYARFRDQLKEMSKKNIYMKNTRLLKQKELNNAVLLQIARYTPPKETGLNILFKETCQKNFDCWFRELEKLKVCTPQNRKMILQKKITVKNLLKACEDK